jgi:hypothetical protein
MDELLYLLIKAIIGAMSGPRAAPPTVDRPWQQRVREQQRLMQLAAAARVPIKPPAPPPRAASVKPTPAPTPATAWVEPERASRHGAGRAKSLELARLARPRSLRRRFILTEILRPPVSLRRPQL